MADSESALLERFVGTGDTEAFAQIVRRYAGLVYGTCLRVLADMDRAADATQETFFQLMKRAGEVRGSLAGWLHRVATGKAVDLIRSDSARRQRERAYLDDKAGGDQTWQEVSPHVDEALTRLDDDTRDLLVRHYLEGVPMAEIGRQRGVSRPTVSREIESGLARLRAQLHRQGVLVAAGALSTLLAHSAAQSAPSVVLQQLGKMALMGAKAAPVASVSSLLGGGLAAAAKVKVIIAVVVVAGAGLVAYTTFSSGPSRTPPVPAATGREDRQPAGPASARPDRPKTQDAQSPAPDRPATKETNSTSMSPSQPTVPRSGAEAQPSVPWWNPTDKKEGGFHLDLSTPEAAVRSFTKAMVSGNAESVMACFLPGGTDYGDMQEILNAGPDDPRQRGKYEMKLWLQSLDPDADMPIIESVEEQGAMKMTWQVTFKKDVTVSEGGGPTFHAGDTYNLDATLRQSGDSWLIDNF
jgi:RNA polymerase sigma-70 factor (ECF subfamily)